MTQRRRLTAASSPKQGRSDWWRARPAVPGFGAETRCRRGQGGFVPRGLHRRHVIHRRPSDRGITACRGVDLSHDIPPISPRAAVLPGAPPRADRRRARGTRRPGPRAPLAGRRRLARDPGAPAPARTQPARLCRRQGLLRQPRRQARTLGRRPAPRCRRGRLAQHWFPALCDTGRARSFRFDLGHDGLAGIGARGAGRRRASAPRASSGRHRDDTAFVVVHQAWVLQRRRPVVDLAPDAWSGPIGLAQRRRTAPWPGVRSARAAAQDAAPGPSLGDAELRGAPGGVDPRGALTERGRPSWTRPPRAARRTTPARGPACRRPS